MADAYAIATMKVRQMLITSKPLFVYLQRPDTGEWVTVGRYQVGAEGSAIGKEPVGPANGLGALQMGVARHQDADFSFSSRGQNFQKAGEVFFHEP